MRWVRSRTAVVALVAVVAALTICLGTWQGWLAQAQTVRWVNDADDAGEPTECSTATAYANIAAALGASSDGDIIRLCEGEYEGDVHVTREVTIEGREGVERGDVLIEVAPASPTDGLIVAADGVTIRHLALDGPGPYAGTWSGIRIDPGSNHTTISDVEATDWNDSIHGWSDFADTVIEGSYLHDCYRAASLTDGAQTVIRDNQIRSNITEGLRLEDEDEALVEGNTLSGNSAEIVVDGYSHVRIYRNQIETLADGIVIQAVPAEAFIQIGGSPENANSFSGPFGAPDYYVELDCLAENTVDATYNFWGTGLARSDIAARIFNDEDDDGTECAAPDDVRGAVVFHPWATEPAPTPSPSPTPTPSPTPSPSPSPTPVAGTRDFDLQLGWNNFVWTGADATAADTALNCIAGDFAIAYALDAGGWQRYVPDQPDITTLATVDKYDNLLVLVTASDVQCLEMPVDP